MIIRLAEERDLDAVAKTYEELLAWEEAQGTHTNWKRGVYPTYESAAAACRTGTLHVVESKECILGSIILNHIQPDVYRKIAWHWPTPNDKALILHTLCIPPSMKGCGIGRLLMTYALSYGRQQGNLTARLDTWEHNMPAAALYQSLGFSYVGKAETLFQGHIPEQLIFFDYNLSASQSIQPEA